MNFYYKCSLAFTFLSSFGLKSSEDDFWVPLRPEKVNVRFHDEKGRMLEGGGTNSVPLFVRKFTARGSLDTSFADNGIFYGYDYTNLTGRLDDKAQAWSFAIDEDGNIYVGGTQGADLLLIKLDSQGNLITDPTGITEFKREGLATISVKRIIDNINQISIDKDNIYIRAEIRSPSYQRIYSIKLDLNGIVKEFKVFMDEKEIAEHFIK